MVNQSESHEFALYNDHLLSTVPKPGHRLLIDQEELVHRLSKVLRVKEGSYIIIFNQKHHVQIHIERITRNKEIEATVGAVHTNTPLLPRIHWLVPLLEHNAFEEALSALTILGAASIQPVVTTKTHRNTLSTKEHERLRRIMIAASEQSKQFVLPVVKPIQSLNASVVDSQNNHVLKVFFDPQGKPSLDLIAQTQLHPDAEILCLVGPEGDLTNDEKELLKAHTFSFYKLTQPILRSEHAIWVSMGILRCLISRAPERS